MIRSILMTGAALSLGLAPMAGAQTVDGTKFRSVEEGAWYHPVEPDKWIYLGAQENELYGILTRIEEATGVRSNPDQPDTIVKYGPGNWVYEFTLAGDAAMDRGDYQAAVIYYHTGAAPHTSSSEQDAALESARAAYAMAMEGVGVYEEVQIAHAGASFMGHLHVPEGEGPFPVLVMSNGSDMSSVVTLSYYTEHLMPNGIAFLTIDVPGMGRSAAYDVTDGATENLHVAAAEWAMADPRLDARNVFVQGISFAGNAAARVFTQHADLDLAGVIYTCGPLHSAFMAPPEAYAHFPAFTIDGVKTRLGLPVDASFVEFAEAVRILSIENVGAFDGPSIETPILAITTSEDPVAPVEEMDRLLARATKAERIVFDMPGHCPPHNQREPIVAAWIIDNLR